MKYQLKAYSIYEFGSRKDEQGNPHQEDALFPAHKAATGEDRLFVLCDGMGGHEAGEVASETVCEVVGQHVLNAETPFCDSLLHQAIDTAYDALDARCPDPSAPRKMGTTMTLLALHAQGATIAHIGDSRVYHIRPGGNGASTRILFHTEDHSVVNSLVKIGEMTPEQAKVSSKKNVLTRAMQPCMERRAQADVYHTTDIRPGDYFYLCSDGMLEQMEDEELRHIFSHEGGRDEQKIKQLRQATKDNKDNHSAIVVHIVGIQDPIESASTETTDPNDPPRHRTRRWGLWLLLALLLLAALAVLAIYFRHGDTPKPIVPPIQRPQL